MPKTATERPAAPRGEKIAPPRIVRALVVRNPWAEQIRDGIKTIEYRCWRTHYRGPLLIVVARANGGPLGGHGIVLVDLYDCVQAGPRNYEWMLRNRQIVEPFSVPGRLGIFPVSLSVGTTGFISESFE